MDQKQSTYEGEIVQSEEHWKQENEREMRTRGECTDWDWARVCGQGVRTQF